MDPEEFTIAHSSDDSVVIRFKEGISPEIAVQVRRTVSALREVHLGWISDMVPSYCEVLVTYDIRRIAPFDAITQIRAVAGGGLSSPAPAARLIRLPVCYGGDFGPDIGFVSEHTGLDKEELIRLHTAPRYLIYMIGFTIGYPYLGGLDERLAVPRLASPRQRVAAGSVGIAGKQTGIYTLETPGGWQIIGRCPVRLVDVDKVPPALLSAGDYLEFFPVDEGEYERIRQLSYRGEYAPEASDCEAIRI